jgi:hypothetical protein
VHGPCQGEEDDVSQLATKADLKEAFDSVKRDVAELDEVVSGNIPQSLKRFERKLTLNITVMLVIAVLFAYAFVL